MRPGWVGLLLMVFALVACHASEDARGKSAENSELVQSGSLKFVCMHEADHWPAIDPEADRLFQYGRWLQKQPSPQDVKSIGRLYRIAAANGHFKAANNLQNLISVGIVGSIDAPAETIDLVQQLIKENVPAGYYAMGHYLELGYGVEEDKQKAVAYFRKAADLGNADAQYYLAEQLAPIDVAPDVAKQMRQCATDQGYGPAANSLGVDLQDREEFTGARRILQQGVRSGDVQCASLMEGAFDPERLKYPIYFMGITADIERSHRYNLIRQFLHRYDGRNPKVPDIDKIVPLPPAPLPAWDGTFQWEKEFKSAKAPEMPSEALIKKLARAKGLDPATGLPLAKAK